MAITKNIVIGISDIHNEPDAILFKSTSKNDDVNIEVVAQKFAVKQSDVLEAIKTIKEFIQKREPIVINKDSSLPIVYGEDDNN